MPRLAFIGVGHPFLRDDRAGGLLIQALDTLLLTKPEEILLLNVSGSPENFLGPIMRFCPDHLFMIDAVDMGKTPGSIVTLEWSPEIHLDTQPFSLPLDKFCLFISTECRCPITVVGIQAQTIGYGSEVSEAVKSAIEYLAQEFHNEWKIISDSQVNL